jgi:hypothetical protein
MKSTALRLKKSWGVQMPDTLDWAALHKVFASPAPCAEDDHLPRWLALDLAEERAAIMEYCGGLSRKEAEAYAFRNIPDAWP